MYHLGADSCTDAGAQISLEKRSCAVCPVKAETGTGCVAPVIVHEKVSIKPDRSSELWTEIFSAAENEKRRNDDDSDGVERETQKLIDGDFAGIIDNESVYEKYDKRIIP